MSSTPTHIAVIGAGPAGLMAAEVLGEGGAAVTVPLEALQEHGGEQIVFVAEGEGYRRRVVRVGPTLGAQVVIEAGVKAGDRVVTRGAYQLLARVRS